MSAKRVHRFLLAIVASFAHLSTHLGGSRMDSPEVKSVMPPPSEESFGHLGGVSRLSAKLVIALFAVVIAELILLSFVKAAEAAIVTSACTGACDPAGNNYALIGANARPGNPEALGARLTLTADNATANTCSGLVGSPATCSLADNFNNVSGNLGCYVGVNGNTKINCCSSLTLDTANNKRKWNLHVDPPLGSNIASCVFSDTGTSDKAVWLANLQESIASEVYCPPPVQPTQPPPTPTPRPNPTEPPPTLPPPTPTPIPPTPVPPTVGPNPSCRIETPSSTSVKSNCGATCSNLGDNCFCVQFASNYYNFSPTTRNWNFGSNNSGGNTDSNNPNDTTYRGYDCGGGSRTVSVSYSGGDTPGGLSCNPASTTLTIPPCGATPTPVPGTTPVPTTPPRREPLLGEGISVEASFQLENTGQPYNGEGLITRRIPIVIAATHNNCSGNSISDFSDGEYFANTSAIGYMDGTSGSWQPGVWNWYSPPNSYYNLTRSGFRQFVFNAPGDYFYNDMWCGDRIGDIDGDPNCQGDISGWAAANVSLYLRARFPGGFTYQRTTDSAKNVCTGGSPRETFCVSSLASDDAPGDTEIMLGGASNEANAYAGGTFCAMNGNRYAAVTYKVFPPKYTISGNVLKDYNRDATKNGKDEYYNGAVVQLWQGGSKKAEVTTGADGNYSFANLYTGGYTVVFSNIPSSWYATDGRAFSRNVTLSTGNLTENFAVAPYYTIWGKTFLDYNGDGVKNGNDTDFVFTDANGWYFPIIWLKRTLPTAYDLPQVRVDATATYEYGTNRRIQNGTYTVELVWTNIDKTVYRITTPAGAPTDKVTLTLDDGNQTRRVDFGLQPRYTIAGSIFADVDGNGAKTAADPLFTRSAVKVELFPATGDMNSTTLIETDWTTTDGSQNAALDGTYTFGNEAVRRVVPGSYRVRVTLPSGHKQVIALTVPPTTTNLRNVTVGTSNVSGVNFLIQGYRIAGTVFEDRNVPPDGYKDCGDDGYCGNVSGEDIAYQGARVVLERLSYPDYQVLETYTAATTDLYGNYAFNNLPMTSIFRPSPRDLNRITLTVPTGYTTSYLGSMVNPGYTITAYGDIVDADFSMAKQYTIQGSIFADADGNGARTTGITADPLFTTSAATPVTVELYSAGTRIASLTTTTGQYTFNSRINGRYIVKVVKPSTHKQVLALTAPPRPNEQTITVNNGNVSDANFLIQGYRISGTVWVDYNHNGARDFNDLNGDSIKQAVEPWTDPGYPDGARIVLSGAASKTAQTESSGNYSFENLTTGTYSVDLNPVPTGYTNNHPRYPTALADPASVTITNADMSAPFSITKVYSIEGNVYLDNNRNEVRDTGEATYTGPITVELTTGTTRLATYSCTTNCTGAYTFSNLLSDEYVVGYMNVPSGYEESYPRPLGYSATVGLSCGFLPSGTTSGRQVNAYCLNGSIKDLNFGIAPLYTISGKVWRDNNQSNTITPTSSPADTAFANATVQLERLNPATNTYTLVTTTTSIATGTYSFINLTPATYRVTVPTPSGFKRVIYSPTGLTVSNANETADFLVQGFTIGINVFEERSVPTNGTKDAGDANYQGASVKLFLATDTSETNLLQTCTSDANGNCTFINLTANNYRVHLTPDPSGFTSSYPAAPSNPNTSVAANTINPTPSVSFGLTRYYTILGTVYLDNDDSSTINAPPDTGFANVTVKLSILNVATNTYVYLTGRDQTTNANGAFTFSNLTNAQYKVEPQLPSGYKSLVPTDQTPTISNSNVPNVNFLLKFYRITAHVFKDNYTPPPPSDRWVPNSSQERPQDPDYQNASVDLLNAAGTTVLRNLPTDASGNAVFLLTGGTYTVRLNAVSGHRILTTNPLQRTIINTDMSVTFAITPLYTISGVVYVDDNKNGILDGAEGNYSGSITVTSTGGSLSTSGATYTVSNIIAGTYTISYGPVPSGYRLTYPQPASYTATVGLGCSFSPNQTPTGIALNASCDVSRNIQNLNFGITNSRVWCQCQGGDCRNEAGFTCPVPTTASAACGGPYASIPGPTANAPGIIFSGEGSVNVSPGQISSTNWNVAGTAYSGTRFTPVNPGVIRTSYNYLLTAAQQKGTPLNLPSSCASTAGCPLSTLNGVYHQSDRNVNVYLNASTIPSGSNVTILAKNDVVIQGEIKVASGGTFTVSAGRDIRVRPDVGAETTSTACNPTLAGHPGCNVEGFYSADNSFIIETKSPTGNGEDSCATAITSDDDKRFNLAGVVVVNAALLGGSFSNQRDICGANKQCPTYTFTYRPDLVLNAPDPIHSPSFIWQEVAP